MVVFSESACVDNPFPIDHANSETKQEIFMSPVLLKVYGPSLKGNSY